MSVCTNMTKKAYTRNGSASRSSCQAGAARLTRGRITRGPQGGGATRKEARELMLPPRMYVGRAALIAATKTQAAASSSAPSTAWLAPQGLGSNADGRSAPGPRKRPAAARWPPRFRSTVIGRRSIAFVQMTYFDFDSAADGPKGRNRPGVSEDRRRSQRVCHGRHSQFGGCATASGRHAT
jgi:hypothetical protein